MPITESQLGRWSHHGSATASKQAHLSIRDALARYDGWASGTKHDVLLQGSYKNDTNLRGDSDVDVVVTVNFGLAPQVAGLSGRKLLNSEGHRRAYQKWKLSRRHTLKALRAQYGDDPLSEGGKSLKLRKGKIPVSADIVPTVQYESGIALYVPYEERWAVSFPQRHHKRGISKERATGTRYKRTIRMFKSGRNHLVEQGVISGTTAPSYFIECLLYNVPDRLFGDGFVQTYRNMVDWLSTARVGGFACQNGVQELFGPGRDQWQVKDAKRFVGALTALWVGGL